MSIQSKFSVLLALLGLTVAICLGSAMFFGRVLEREIVDPMRASAEVMGALAHLKRDLGQLTRLLPGPGRDVPGAADVSGEEIGSADRQARRAAYEAMRPAVVADLESLFERSRLELKVGISTARNLHARIEEAFQLADEWFADGDADVGRAAGGAHFDIHELIELIEVRMLANTEHAFVHADAMRRMHAIILGSGVIGTLLFTALTALLVRRWVVRPVGELRLAASEIAKGHFDHVIAVDAQDELGLLAREVQQMSGSIARMQQEAVERERLAAIGEMVRRIAHNIRNPLAGIRSVAELSRRRAPADSPIHADQTEIMLTVDRFNQWLNDLLRATSPLSLELVEVEPGPWLRGIVESHQPLARMREVTLTTHLAEAPRTARFDPRHLEHAVVAILTNALQASPAGTTVSLGAIAPSEPGFWDIRVSDQGPGIPEQIRELIFRPYFTTKKDGNGIGLASALQIVKQHGGRILVESAQNQGTAFIVRLPLAGIESKVMAEISHTAEPSRNGASPGDDPGHRG